jgi:hypothetical protein
MNTYDKLYDLLLSYYISLKLISDKIQFVAKYDQSILLSLTDFAIGHINVTKQDNNWNLSIMGANKRKLKYFQSIDNNSKSIKYFNLKVTPHEKDKMYYYVDFLCVDDDYFVNLISNYITS